jgi:hypothetical protein
MTIPMTPTAALAAFHQADLARTAAYERMADAKRTLGHARTAFDLADAARTTAMYLANDAWRMAEHKAVDLDTNQLTPTQEHP